MSYQFTISDIGLRLIKAYEGYRAEPRTLASGGRVIGFGHSVEADDDATLSEEDAEAALNSDLAPIEDLINSHVHASMTQSQFDALCSLAFSIGEKAFMSSNILHAMNKGQIIEAANGFDLWRKGNINGQIYVVDALVRRRTAEKALFLRPTQRTARAPRYELTAIKDTDLPELSGVVELAATAPEFEAAALQSTTTVEEEDVSLNMSDALSETDLEDISNDGDDTTRRGLSTAPVAVLYDNEPDTQNIFDTPILDRVEDDEALDLNVVAAPPSGALADTFPETTLPVNIPDVANDYVDTVDDENITESALVDDAIESILPPVEHPFLDADETVDLDTVSSLDDDIQDTLEDTVTPPADTPVIEETSPIAAAAAEVSDRLDALIYDPAETKTETIWPDSLITSSIQPNSAETADFTTVTDDQPADVIIDELQRDDALRVQDTRDSQFNTDKYVEYANGTDNQPQGGLWAFFTMMIVGLTLLLAGFGVNMSGSRNILGENGPFIAITAMAIGFLLLLGGSWYLIKALFFKD